MHRHRSNPALSAIYGFTGPVTGAIENRRAHGGVRFVDRCQCGATRATNSNGGATERGPWREPESTQVRS